MKTEFDLSIEEVRDFCLGLVGVSLSGRSFIKIKGKDYLIIDIENALIKNTGINAIK